MAIRYVDVAVVGAGISGIDAAYHLQTRCPGTSFAIIEAREQLGGTWDLFRYPGIRSDSDMYTLGFPFRPWAGANGIADGASILAYIRDTAAAYGIDRRIQFATTVERARWSSRDARWTLELRNTRTNESSQLACKFLHVCTGYFDYTSGHVPELPGMERFGGKIVHAQQWTPEISYAGRRVIVVGSGATAVNLVPELAKHAAHVTMLQRSPSYVMSVPAHDHSADWLRSVLPARLAHALTRWKYVLAAMGFHGIARRFPNQTRHVLVRNARRALRGTDVPEAHFAPRYQPWDERVCFIPDGDLFVAIRSGAASIVTDRITSITNTGLELATAGRLDADLIVLATGLRLKWFGGISVEVDGADVELARTMVYQGMMLSGVPNFAFATGYTTSSWTLRCDLTSRLLCRLIEHMDRNGYTRCCPRRDPSVAERPLIELTSGYVERARAETPRIGSSGPWRAPRNYIVDSLALLYPGVEDSALELTR